LKRAAGVQEVVEESPARHICEIVEEYEWTIEGADEIGDYIHFYKGRMGR